MTSLTPVLLAGGLGKRLWPISRQSCPKQFVNFLGNNTLFQQSALRFISSNEIVFSKHITITNSDYRFIVSDQFQKVGIDPGPILIEPETKNTAPAILAAAIYAEANNKNSVLVVAPTDHLIPDTRAFHNAILQGKKEVLDGKIVTFGIPPTRPETGYGYLSISKQSKNEALVVNKFLEKPDIKTAETMFRSGNYLWNAGIFLFKATDMIELFRKFEPDIWKLVTTAIETSDIDLGFLRINPEPWSKLKNISVDYAIMEKAKNIIAVPFPSKWSDLGGWDAVWSETEKDFSGNSILEGSHVIDCTNSFLQSDNPRQKIVGLGLENIIAVATSDAVLVTHKDRAQDVKKVVDLLKSKNVSQAEIFPKDYRPWGWFETLAIGNCFQVKRIFIKPNASISLQSHRYRSEHWVIVNGSAQVTIEDEVKMIAEGQSVFVPQGSVHRIENLDKMSLVLVEVQIGSYLGEDDIVRYEDIYARK
jgi:mannose-1-phosphate guanylyltransferase / mannose-6-phosphate isomerase